MKTKDVHNMEDFVDCVTNAYNNKTTTIELNINNFYDWPDAKCPKKKSKIVPNPYLNLMSRVKFQKSFFNLA
jgi:hypothetical protein